MALTVSEAAFITFISTFLLSSFIGNVCVLVVIVKNRTMRTVTNIFLSNLAVSDMILASLVLPQQVHDVSHTDEYFERTLTIVYDLLSTYYLKHPILLLLAGDEYCQ